MFIVLIKKIKYNDLILATRGKQMKYVEDKIKADGVILGEDILKVDNFVNHQIDMNFALKVAKYFASKFKDVDKVLTIETSGIVFAALTAMELGNIPLVFAKKSKSKIVDAENLYHAQVKSFTRNTISDVVVDKRFLNKEEKILIVDDFLAEGNAGLGLIDICNQAGAKVIGFASVIEKTFQGGRKKIQDLGIKVVTTAPIKEFNNGQIVFGDEE